MYLLTFLSGKPLQHCTPHHCPSISLWRRRLSFVYCGISGRSGNTNQHTRVLSKLPPHRQRAFFSTTQMDAHIKNEIVNVSSRYINSTLPPALSFGTSKPIMPFSGTSQRIEANAAIIWGAANYDIEFETDRRINCMCCARKDYVDRFVRPPTTTEMCRSIDYTE
jgi:hypothetical protein